MGHRAFSGSWGFEQAAVPGRRRVPRSLALRLVEPGSRDRCVDRSSLRSGGSLLPLRARPMYGPGPKNHNGLIHELAGGALDLIPELVNVVDGLWILVREVPDPWPICSRGSWRSTTGGRALRRLQPSLAVGAVRTDPPDQGPAERPLAGPSPPRGHRRTSRSACSSARSSSTWSTNGRPPTSRSWPRSSSWSSRPCPGLADYTDTDGTARTRATTHATLMTVALVILIVSLVIRAGDPADRTVAVVLGIVAFGLVSGGGVRRRRRRLRPRQHGQPPRVPRCRHEVDQARARRRSPDLDDLAEATPTKMKAGINDLVVVRLGERVFALHATCAHAGGPLDKGTVVDGCVQCPWHGARYRLDGRPRRARPIGLRPARATRSRRPRAVATRSRRIAS